MNMKNIRPWLMLQDNTRIPMVLGKTDDNSYHFRDEKERATFKLEVKKDGNMGAVYVDAVIKPHEFPYGNMNYLNLDCAVGIDMDFSSNTEAYMSDYLYGEYWCRPYIGTDMASVPDDTQALLLKMKGGDYLFILPVCDKKYKGTICGYETGISIKLFSWYYGLNECKSLAFLFARGSNPFELVENCVEYGLKLLNNGCKTRKERSYPDIFNYLGWCSWDAMQIRVNAHGLMDKCEEFKQKDIPVKWIIIDDMWAEVKGLNELEYETFEEMVVKMHRQKLYSFEADPVRFPKGLKDCIMNIKERYGVKVGMWHPTTGYWKGIDPHSNIALRYKDLLVETGDGKLVPSPNLHKAFLFYNAFHSFLRMCGADFVKIDNQSFIRGYYKGMIPLGEAAGNLHKAMEGSVGINFDGKLINCMGMAQENLWNRPVSAISRCSGDFLPENKAWFIKHILQCSYNSFIQGNFLWCDWDMWWTDDAQATKNSVLRAISGGPVYISDKQDRSIRDVVMPLVFSDGRILRCDRPAMPTLDCLTVDTENNPKPFKVWNRCGQCGVVAAFNLYKGDSEVKGFLSMDDVMGLYGDEFAIYEHFSKKLMIINREEKIKLSLQDQDDFKLYIIVPMTNGFAPIGLVNKYISPKSIISGTGKQMELVEGGVLAFVSKDAVNSVEVNGEAYEVNNDKELYFVDCGIVKGKARVTIR